MYKRTIWVDHREGVQLGTDMNAANFNNLEAGTMEANALAAINAEYIRYGNDVAKNSEATIIDAKFAHNAYVAIPTSATRNNVNYSVLAEITNVPEQGTAGDIFIVGKQANGFSVGYNGTATSVDVRFYIIGGMI